MRFAQRTTIDADDVARAYGISRESAYGQAGALGAIRIGRRLVFPVAKVAADLGITTEELLDRCETVANGNGHA
jgi:hypothetical protein